MPEWLKGYVHGARFNARRRKQIGWARTKGEIKKTLKFWAISHCFTMGDAQKGMVDAMLDSVGC